MPVDPVQGLAPWRPDSLRPLFEELIPAAEQESVAALTGKAAKAKLPPPVLREIEAGARWPTTAKTGLIVSGPEVCAKWLNKIGISAENQAELIVCTAVGSILFGHLRLSRRLEKMIAEQNGEEKPAAAAAPEAAPQN